jgi:tetratricopeptide (TPR) repeat protein
MKYFSSVILASLVVAIPISNVYPNSGIPEFSIQKSLEIPDPRNFSYDEVMDLLALIESDSFEERCSPDQLTQVNQLLSFLAMEGATENEKIDVERSIASLFKTDDCQFAYWIDSNIQYIAEPAILRHESQNIMLCRSWFKKQWDQTRDFVHKHKKEIIIGIIVVVAVTAIVITAVVISSSAAGAAAGGFIASAEALEFGSNQLDPNHNVYQESAQLEPHETLTSSLQEQISTFKENIAQEHLTEISDFRGISMEENGRIIGSLFTHKTIDTLTTQASENPFLGRELQDLGNNVQCPLPKWTSGFGPSPHTSTDLAFSTNYSATCIGNNTDLNTLAYQARGDWSLSSGCYDQAVHDFGRAIEIEPNNSESYLGRGIANFELGRYEESIADYNTYVSQVNEPFSVADFSVGFAKGLPKGIYDSGEGMLQFVADLACHPVQTSEKVYDSISTLGSLAKSGEWNLIGEALSPELHQLVSEWDTLSSGEKGELSGYAFGKHGADILLPAGAAKAVAKGTVAAKELGAICKNLQSAEKLLILEAVAEGSSAGINVGEVVIKARKTFITGADVGFSAREISQLKQAEKLEGAINSGLEKLVSQSESEVLKAAINQNKHVKMVRDYLDKPVKEVQKGINSYEKQIALHKDKIVNPTKHCPDWNKLDPRQCEALVNKKWPAEIKVYEEQKNVLQSILNERLSHE